VEPEHVTKNQVAYQILLFNSERNWAFAMDCKKKGENRQKFHARKKLKKSVKAAEELVVLLEKISSDSSSKLEASAYLESLSGALDIEYERYQEAMNHLIKSKVIYQSISQNKDSLEAAIYGDKVT
jgi:signal recognition particle subunit SRP68